MSIFFLLSSFYHSKTDAMQKMKETIREFSRLHGRNMALTQEKIYVDPSSL